MRVLAYQGPDNEACGKISSPERFADADTIIRFGTTSICASALHTRAA